MPRLNRFSGALRPCIAFLLYVCAWATFPPAYADQQAPSDPQSFAADDPARHRARPSGRGRSARETASGDRRRRRGGGARTARHRARPVRRGDRHPRAGRGARARQAKRRCNSACSHLQLGRAQAGHPAAQPRCSQQGSAGPDAEALFRGGARRACARPSPRRQLALQRGRRALPRTLPSTRPGACCSSRNTTSRRRCARCRTPSRPTRSGRPRTPAWRACSPTRIRRPPPRRRARRSRSTSELADAQLLLAELDLNNSQARRRAR